MMNGFGFCRTVCSGSEPRNLRFFMILQSASDRRTEKVDLFPSLPTIQFLVDKPLVTTQLLIRKTLGTKIFAKKTRHEVMSTVSMSSVTELEIALTRSLKLFLTQMLSVDLSNEELAGVIWSEQSPREHVKVISITAFSPKEWLLVSIPSVYYHIPSVYHQYTIIYHQYTIIYTIIYHQYTIIYTIIYYQYITSILSLYHQCTAVYHQYTISIPSVYYQYITSILSSYHHCTAVYHQYTISIYR